MSWGAGAGKVVLGALLSQGRGGGREGRPVLVTVPSDLSARMVRTKQAACLGTGAVPLLLSPCLWGGSSPGCCLRSLGSEGKTTLGGEPWPGRVVSWWHRKAPAWEQGCAGSKRCWLSGAGHGGLGAQCMLSLADVRVLRGGLGTESLLLHIARVTWLCWPEAS